MIRQRVDIPAADWLVDIFYDVRPCDTDEITDILLDMGCPFRNLRRARRLLDSGIPNQGLTYSDEIGRCSFVAIGHTTNVFECINLISHECQHIEQAICKADGLDPYGEDIAYVSGAISEAISRNAWQTMRKIFLNLL